MVFIDIGTQVYAVFLFKAQLKCSQPFFFFFLLFTVFVSVHKFSPGNLRQVVFLTF
jgi:hypothetical protein